MSTRLLHVADLHLDRAFAGMGCQGELAIRRRLGLREALRRAGQTALERGCAAVTIGGDLYEHDRAGAATAAFMVETFASWQPMRVLLAPGNHDALLTGSIYSRTEWPANVHLFSTAELRPVALADGLTIWGLAHLEPAWQGDPLAGGDTVGGDGGVHLALFHGAEVGLRPEGKSMHGPFRATDVHRRGFAAALCGHYHRRRVDAGTGLLYPGSPEPLTFDESEPRGAVIVTVAGDGTISHEPLEDNRWHACTAIADVSTARGLADVVDAAAAAAVAACAALDPDRVVLRVDLRGEIDHAVPTDNFTVETAVRDACGAAGVRVRDLTSPAQSVDAIEAEATVRGAFARAVAAASESADTEQRRVLADALRYGLQALGGSEIGLR
ncbi:MAG TPA: metallophosphoesterase [Candidatus Dormibacteraeota bacterium]|jgi:DNA repair exonuclease SbcCD nuclease subunit|nr:metallophosphoesterase [Candidatus Dormibacteraeota bacterium]